MGTLYYSLDICMYSMTIINVTQCQTPERTPQSSLVVVIKKVTPSQQLNN